MGHGTVDGGDTGLGGRAPGVHRVARDGDDLFVDAGLDGGCHVGGLDRVACCAAGHHLGRLANPQHLLVLAEVPVAAEGFLDNRAGHHAEFATVLALLVHTAGDGCDFFRGGVGSQDWGGACVFAVFAPFAKHGKHADLGLCQGERVVWCDNGTEAGEVIWVAEYSEGSADVSADDGSSSQSSLAQGERKTFRQRRVQEKPCVLQDLHGVRSSAKCDSATKTL